MTDNNLPVYDEDDAIVFIRQTLPEDINRRYTDDDIMEVIDAIWDYYDESGATSLDNITVGDDEDESQDPAAIAQSIIKVLAKNGPEAINVADLTLIVKGEIAYEENLGSCL